MTQNTERAAVVAWLRERAALIGATSLSVLLHMPPGSRWWTFVEVLCRRHLRGLLLYAANAIERGDHITSQEIEP